MMIVLNLVCIAGHHFEGWFASCDAFDEQLGRQQVNCPRCNSAEVSRLPSGPHIAKGSLSSASIGNVGIGLEQMVGLIRQLAAASEDVGERFAEEVRRMHFDEAPVRQIKGLATLAETMDLIEDGIAVIPLLSPPKDEIH
jgi:hypothetical protein